jgi:hypothetical protein
MQKIIPPPQGYNPEQLPYKLIALSRNIVAYKEVLESEIYRVSIVVDAIHKGHGEQNKIFEFSSGNIPVEIREFFEMSLNRMQSEKIVIETGFQLYRIGNSVVEFTAFTKVNTEGETPAVDSLDIQRMQNMQIGQAIVIGIYNNPTKVERIS